MSGLVPGQTPTVMAMSITPFTTSGKVDEAELRAHLRRLIDADLGVYLGSPGSGEGHALTIAETRDVYDVGVAECKGRVPVYANPREARTAAQMLSTVREAVAAGVDVVQVYQPEQGHGYRPTPAELDHYFREVIAHVDHPVALGCNPIAGYVAPVEVIERLCADFEQIVALNIVSTPPEYVVACRDRTPDRVRLFVGQIGAVAGWCLGASGIMTAAANVIPRTCARQATAFARGDLAQLREATQRIQRLYADVVHGGPRWQKTALKVLGLPGGSGVVRGPYLPATADEEARMRLALDRLGVPEWESLEPVNAG
jgi:4-hydroxy-tetrahydrodipicolinate synthase